MIISSYKNCHKRESQKVISKKLYCLQMKKIVHQKFIKKTSVHQKKFQNSENQKLEKIEMSWSNAKQVNWKRIGKNEKKQVADTIIPKASPEILKWKECGGEYSMWKI